MSECSTVEADSVPRNVARLVREVWEEASSVERWWVPVLGVAALGGVNGLNLLVWGTPVSLSRDAWFVLVAIFTAAAWALACVASHLEKARVDRVRGPLFGPRVERVPQALRGGPLDGAIVDVPAEGLMVSAVDPGSGRTHRYVCDRSEAQVVGVVDRAAPLHHTGPGGTALTPWALFADHVMAVRRGVVWAGLLTVGAAVEHGWAAVAVAAAGFGVVVWVLSFAAGWMRATGARV